MGKIYGIPGGFQYMYMYYYKKSRDSIQDIIISCTNIIKILDMICDDII